MRSSRRSIAGPSSGPSRAITSIGRLPRAKASASHPCPADLSPLDQAAAHGRRATGIARIVVARHPGRTARDLLTSPRVHTTARGDVDSEAALARLPAAGSAPAGLPAGTSGPAWPAHGSRAARGSSARSGRRARPRGCRPSRPAAPPGSPARRRPRARAGGRGTGAGPGRSGARCRRRAGPCELDPGARLLPCLAAGTLLDRLAKLQIARRDGPVTRARRDRPPAQEQPVAEAAYAADNDLGVLVVDRAAGRADVPRAVVAGRTAQLDLRPAARAEPHLSPARRRRLRRAS